MSNYLDSWYFRWNCKWKFYVPYGTRYWTYRTYWAIKDFLFPQQQWLRKVIPRSYQDKVELLPAVLFAFIVDFVEQENPFQFSEWDDLSVPEFYPDEPEAIKAYLEHATARKEAGEFIRACYQYIKVERPKAQKEIDDMEAKTSEDLERLIASEEAMTEKDTAFLTGIVKYRNYLWT